MSMADQKKTHRQAARDAVDKLEAAGALYAQTDAGQLQRIGSGPVRGEFPSDGRRWGLVSR